MKKLTLVLSMLIALIGFNANAAIYLIGDAPMGGWNFNGSAGIEMEDNGDGTYSYVVTIGTATSPKTVYFAFADGWGTSWDDFNNNHRYGPQNGGQTLTGDWASVGMYGDRSFKFMGTGEEYKVTFDLNNLRAKIEGYVAPVEITTYTVVTGLNDWAIDEANDMTLENGVYTLSMENVQLSAGTFEYKTGAMSGLRAMATTSPRKLPATAFTTSPSPSIPLPAKQPALSLRSRSLTTTTS